MLGVNAFARHVGVSPTTVSKAITAGDIPIERRDSNGNPIIDPKKAAKAWAENKRLRRESVAIHALASGDPEIEREPADEPEEEREDVEDRGVAKSRAKRELYEAELARLKYERESGKLVDAETIGQAWFRIVAAARTRLLGVPSKFRTRFPDADGAQVDMLDSLIREALEDLSELSVDEMSADDDTA